MDTVDHRAGDAWLAHLDEALVVENGTWGPMAGKLMLDQLAAMKNIEVLGDKVTIRSTMDRSNEQALTELAENVLP